MSPEGRVASVAVVEHRETPSFFEKALAGRILERLAGRTFKERIVLGEDIDSVSGATYTARAFTQSVQRRALIPVPFQWKSVSRILLIILSNPVW